MVSEAPQQPALDHIDKYFTLEKFFHWFAYYLSRRKAVKHDSAQSCAVKIRWAGELGRIDICWEVSMVSSHLALPREGHRAQVFQRGKLLSDALFMQTIQGTGS